MKLKSSEDVILKHSPEVAWRKVEDEAVILDLETGTYYSLSDIGLLIWEILENGAGQERLVEEITSERSVDPDTARRDIQKFLKHLQKEKLIVPQNE